MLCCHQGVSTCVQLPTRVLEVELTLVSSNHHVEMNPGDVGNNDRYVVQEILKVRYIGAFSHMHDHGVWLCPSHNAKCTCCLSS